MIEAVRRVGFALFGGAVAAVVVALVEARVASDASPRAGSYVALALADVSVLVPVALAVALGVVAASLVLEPDRARSLAERAAAVRAQPVLFRSRTAALAPLATFAVFGWCVTMAHVARVALAHGAPLASGASLAVAGVGAALAAGAVVFALLRPLRRALAFGAQWASWLIDPVVTGTLAGVVVIALLLMGVRDGDTGGTTGVLGIFGVLKRSELDLRPVVNLASIAIGAFLAPLAFGARPSPPRLAFAVLVVAALLGVTCLEATALARAPSAARAIERDAPLGKIALAALRRVTDRDHDGASPFFGGNDCDDRDPHRSPSALEIPDNGVDEDCSGADLHVERLAADVQATVPAAPAPASSLPADLNLIVITVDTLRTDVGFMGYTRDTTPNLDKLAADSVVFDRMYSLASYTGKSIGPLFIGKYPSETKRDGGHFNTYYSANTFVAERMKAAGIRTFGAASHWYFAPWSGLSQGMGVFDLSARPAEGQGDNDTSITSKELSDAAIRLLKKPENTGGRFFAWFHYFDPHEQYETHDDAPKFGTSNKALYDGEVWFTDKHIGRLLDYVRSQPWGERTIIFVTADHGETFGEHNMRQHGYELWEPLVRVPMIMHVPGVAAHHVPVKRSHVDLAPTMLDLMGLDAPPAGELSGKSDRADLILPDAADAGDPARYEERDVFMDMPAGPFTNTRHALIHGTTPGTKLIRLDSGQYELFDLASDPGEKEDLANDKEALRPMVELFEQKRASLKEIVVKPDAPPPSP